MKEGGSLETRPSKEMAPQKLLTGDLANVHITGNVCLAAFQTDAGPVVYSGGVDGEIKRVVVAKADASSEALVEQRKLEEDLKQITSIEESEVRAHASGRENLPTRRQASVILQSSAAVHLSHSYLQTLALPLSLSLSLS